MQQTTDTETVKDLLGLLTSRNKQLSWKMRCIYTDNKNNSVMEIKIHQDHHYQNGARKQICRIAYAPASNQVSQMNYRNEVFQKPGTIVDVLLDIINEESAVLNNRA